MFVFLNKNVEFLILKKTNVLKFYELSCLRSESQVVRADQNSKMRRGSAGVQHGRGKSSTTLDAACYADETWIKITMAPSEMPLKLIEISLNKDKLRNLLFR